MKLLSCLVVLLLSCSMLACSANVETFNSTATLGKQMEDLDASYKAGVITEDEFNKAKNILINRYK